jgi:thiamine-monophosphate kinase
LSEFALIEAIRTRVHVARHDAALGIGDDAALLDVPAGRQLVVCTDTLVAGVHFLRDTAPEDIGWKSLAVNLSDLAAMGAAPAWALLALTLPHADANFVEGFADGFAELARTHGVALVGGDTTQGALSITVTALGLAPPGQVLTRSGACEGDAVFVTGTLGDAAGALRLLRDRRESHPPQSPFLWKGEEKSHPLPQEGGRRAAAGRCVAASEQDAWPDGSAGLLARLHRPEPRIAAGLALRGLAGASIDVSDGLLADLGHVCTASGVGAELDLDALPLSAELRATFDEATCRELALTGGDDYELCFTVPAAREARLQAALAQAGCRAARIGRIVAGSGVRVVDAHGNIVPVARAGWEHFAT